MKTRTIRNICLYGTIASLLAMNSVDTFYPVPKTPGQDTYEDKNNKITEVIENKDLTNAEAKESIDKLIQTRPEMSTEEELVFEAKYDNAMSNRKVYNLITGGSMLILLGSFLGTAYKEHINK